MFGSGPGPRALYIEGKTSNWAIFFSIGKGKKASSTRPNKEKKTDRLYSEHTVDVRTVIKRRRKRTENYHQKACE